MKNELNSVSPAHAQRIVAAAARKNLPVLLLGTPGIGKTAVVEAAARDIGYQYRALYPTDMDPVDLGGLPMPVGDRVRRVLDDELASLCEPECEPTLLLVDELGQAAPSMQAAVAKLFHARTLAGRKISDNVAIVAASNRAQDRAGAGHILSHIISRMASVLDVRADLDSWTIWARDAGVDPVVRAFLAWRGELLDKFDAAAAASSHAYPCPRSWERAGALCALHLGDDDLTPALAGCVGDGAAMEFVAFRRGAAKIDFEKIMGAGTVHLPTAIDMLYAISVGVGMRMRTDATIRRGLDIVEKLSKETPEFAVLTLRESASWPGWTGHKAVAEALNGPIGDLLRAI